MKNIMLVSVEELETFAIKVLKIPKKQVKYCYFLDSIDSPKYWELDILELTMWFLPEEYENYNCDDDFEYIKKFETLTYRLTENLEYFIIYKFLITNNITEMVLM